MTFPLLIAAAVAASPFADLDALDRQVASFTGAAIGQPGGAQTPLDRRLRLNPCRTSIAMSWRTTAQDSVVLQCGDVGGWRLFVPVVRPQPVAQAAAAAPVINRGDAVSIAISGDGFTVSQPGEAMEAGAPGEWIRVRPVTGSVRGGDPMRAQVVRPGLVKLPLP